MILLSWSFATDRTNSTLIRYSTMQPCSEEQILEALSKTSNAAAVARQLGIRGKWVWKVARKARFDLADGRAAKGNPAFSPAERERIVTAFRDDPRAGPVALRMTEEFGRPVDRWKVAYLARKAGLLPPLKARQKPGVDPLDAPCVEIPRSQARQHPPAKFREAQRATMKRGPKDPPLPAGDGWQAIIEGTSLAGAPYPGAFFRLKLLREIGDLRAV
jgi:hypothetical protein